MSSPMRRSAAASAAPALLSAALFVSSASSGLCFVAPVAAPALRGMALSTTSRSPTAPRAALQRRAGGLRMADDAEAEKPRGNPWLRFDTRGGVIVWSIILLVAPFVAYGPLGAAMEDETAAGRIIAAVYTVLLSLAWTGSYVFRVGTKDMTYTKQLKDYEDAVIAKRFEELQEDEVQALLDDLENPGPFKRPGDDSPEPPVIKGSGWRPDQY